MLDSHPCVPPCRPWCGPLRVEVEMFSEYTMAVPETNKRQLSEGIQDESKLSSKGKHKDIPELLREGQRIILIIHSF